MKGFKPNSGLGNPVESLRNDYAPSLDLGLKQKERKQ